MIPSKYTRICIGMLLAVWMFGCEPEISGDNAADSAAIDAVYERFCTAYDELDAAAMTALYHDNALYLPPDTTVLSGGVAIGGTFRRFFDWCRENDARLSISFRILDRQIQGDLATDVGYYFLERRSAGREGEGVNRSTGKFVTVLLRGPSGDWKFHVDGYSGAPDFLFESFSGVEHAPIE